MTHISLGSWTQVGVGFGLWEERERALESCVEEESMTGALGSECAGVWDRGVC